MKHVNKLVVILILTFSIFSTAIATEWTDVTYFKRIDIKMRLTKHDPPIVLEWGKLVGSGELSDKLKAIAVATYYSNMDDIDYNKWKAYCTSDYINDIGMTKEEFERTSKINAKNYPDFRFLNILYELDYLIGEKEYSLVVIYYSPKKLDKLPSTSKGGVADVLIKENVKWKNHVVDIKQPPYAGFYDFTNLEILSRIIETGFVYKSKKHPRLWPFVPCDALKTDSIK